MSFALYRRDTAHLAASGLYDPADEHDACGVGLIASLDGKPSRRIVAMAIEALSSLWHRGAVDADGKTGDGAGIHVQIPHAFFEDFIRKGGQEIGPAKFAIGQIFLPRTDLGKQERCRVIVEREILNSGYTIYGWRQVPIDITVIGEKANATRPEIEQIMIANNRGLSEEQFETDLYVIRRRIERAALEEQIGELYICSLSCRSVIYKGMFLAEQLTAFYPDLNDPRFQSNFAIYHQRYSTNTFPTWSLAQPFRVIAHNGEINTLKGNLNWMRAHETRLYSETYGERMAELKPVIQPGGSDSGQLDNVFEIMTTETRPLPMVKCLLIPDVWDGRASMQPALRDMFSYCNSVMEPWDGPAAICGFAGRWAIAALDRNGLRPLRFAITEDDILVAGSEAGMVRLDEQAIRRKGRLGPGEMLAVDLVEGRFYDNATIHEKLAAAEDYSAWVKNITVIDDLVKRGAGEPAAFPREALYRRLVAAGLTLEDMELVLQPMIEEAKEAVVSMGDDTPLAVLSAHYRGLHHFFRQNFSQVTNPPIDSLREKRAMSLKTRLGNLGNVLDQDEGQCRLLQLDSPVLLTSEFQAMRAYMGESAALIDCTFPADGRAHALREAIQSIRRAAEDAVRQGATHLILTDEAAGPDRAAIPTILATGAVHVHLLRQQLRTFTSLNVRSGECLDVHHLAVLIGVGATTVNAYVAEAAIEDRRRRGLAGSLDLRQCLENYRRALDQGLLKVMSKMGIAVVSSYRGGANFEALGLSRTLVAEYFPAMPSRISGIGMTGIEKRVLDLHRRAWAEGAIALPIGGFYKFRQGSEAHAWAPELIHLLQSAVAEESYRAYKRYSAAIGKLPPIAIRDLLDFVPGGKPISIDEVESITEIRKRFVTPGMSLGALSPEAHGTLNIAMNRIGAKSDSGEGGEDPARFQPQPNGDNANSAIKQVASGRFGVTAEYLTNCREIEIKIAQGAKPGEGGQLPGFKVTAEIARLRHATPGVSLISPPPHHDIYSIEDLAQLIYDLKQINSQAKVGVKLVARSGIGTIAAGIAKAKADVILISGHVGGTGASPHTSIKDAGTPWEMGLAEAHQVLTLNRLRHRVRLRADGGLKTGRDIVIAAILGAEEFGIGTASLVAMGCIMVRQCHSNTCPVGICTQDPALRAHFAGSAEKVVNLFSFIAEEVREILAELGYRRLADIIGRTDLLEQVNRGAPDLDDLDLNPILAQADAGGEARYCTLEGRNEVPDTLDAQMIADAQPLFEAGEKMQLQYNIRNTYRAIGTRLSSAITRRFGMTGLKPGHVAVRLRGSAGQSLGAFAVQGLKLEILGDANDYVGKGLSGGTIVIRPLPSSRLESQTNAIIGNTALYGATSGRLFAAGQAGERFAVRNSGAIVVVEGCGANGCEYMTGGMAVILGPVGDNFAAGMSGGMAFVYDAADELPIRINSESVIWQKITSAHWESELRRLVEEHARETQSRFARRLLNDWQIERRHFRQIVPKEMLERLDHPLDDRPKLRSAE